MVTVYLGTVYHRTLSGEILEEKTEIERETPLCRLIRIERKGRVKKHWIPKSVSTLHKTPKLIDGQWIGDTQVLHIEDWFYKKEIGGGVP